jgi:phage terminase small subunit
MAPNDEQSEPLTDKRQRFIDEYLIDCNATKAARRAGYAYKNARQEGSRLLSIVDIRKEIDARLELAAMAANEAVKHISDIASTRLNDYMVVRPVQAYEEREEYVTVLITHKKAKIKELHAYIGKNKLEKEARIPFDQKIAQLMAEIFEDEQEVERWGDDVTRLVKGKPMIGYQADLDLVKLAKAKGTGRLKSFKHTKDGVQVEMYPADAALSLVLKMHGKLIDRKDITSKGERITGFQIIDVDDDSEA